MQKDYLPFLEHTLKASSDTGLHSLGGFLTPIQGHSLKPQRKYGRGVSNPLQALPLESDIPTIWRPSAQLSVRRSSHLLDRVCTSQNLVALKNYCNRDATITIVWHHFKEEIHVTTTDLRDLLSHTRPIADETITLYLELLTTQYDITNLATNTIPKLHSEGWEAVQRSFAHFRNRPRRNT
jgi:hypothetical protein